MEQNPTSDPGAGERSALRLVNWHDCSLEEANAEAVRRIEIAQLEDRGVLYLGDLPIVAIPREIERLNNQLLMLLLGLLDSAPAERKGGAGDDRRPGFLSDLSPLAELKSLVFLRLSGCKGVSDLSPLAELKSLAKLDLTECERVSGLSPLAELKNLVELDLSGCKGVSDLSPLAELKNLATLNLDRCKQVSDLTPLAELKNLTTLGLNYCRALSFNPVKKLLAHLKKISLFGTRFIDLHSSVCGEMEFDNCRESVIHYYAALGSNPESDAELKVFVLGNGRAGKSYLVQRLKDNSFADIESRNIISTHGVRIEPYMVPKSWELPHPVRLILWDFGGQDIYHGTHAIFLREPALYLLLYTDATENDDIVIDGGFAMRNRRLPYWFDYLQQEAGSNGIVTSPILLLHGRCDELPDPFSVPEPVTRPGPDRFQRLSPATPVSSKDPDGLSFFRPRLRMAIKALLQEYPQPPLPTSWARVRQAIRDMQFRETPRTLTQEDFQALCGEHGCEANAVVLRDALHQMGAVFYRQGIFDDRIIVDQSWALDKVYTIFDRNNTAFLRDIRDKRGKFRRSDLERYFWSTDGLADQEVYLSFMEQCGICFRTAVDRSDEDDGLYIAPDLLPGWEDGPQAEYSSWPATPDAGVTVPYTVLHDGIARTYLSRIGRRAGDKADYWRFGCHFRDRTTGSEALVRTAGNSIRMEARGGAAADLLKTLVDVLDCMPYSQPLTITWDEPAPSPRPPGSRGNEYPEGRLNLEPRAGRKLDRRSLGKLRHAPIDLLQSFFLIGSAVQNGLSLRDLAKVLKGCDRGLVPEALGLTGGNLSNKHNELATLVGKDLINVPEKRTGAWLTPDGTRVWNEIKTILGDLKELPNWRKIYQSYKANLKND